MEKIYLEEFLDKLTKMIEDSNKKEHYQSCINYINLYKDQLKDIIKNDIFREITINYINEFYDYVSNRLNKKIKDEI